MFVAAQLLRWNRGVVESFWQMSLLENGQTDNLGFFKFAICAALMDTHMLSENVVQESLWQIFLHS